MAGNHFGKLFKIVTWGESHGPAIGVVIDGCPAGLELSVDDINEELERRRPGVQDYTSPRQERDEVEMLSGVFEGKTTGTPISLMIRNSDANSESYLPLKDVLRPGHANFTYLKKFGIFDWRGGGRASGRETAARVAAGAVAKKLLKHFDIELKATVEVPPNIEEVIAAKDSVGGVVELVSSLLPVGLGAPVFNKLEAALAQAMLSIPATKGVEFGSGMAVAKMRGSEHNDTFDVDASGEPFLKTNRAGGTLGGISCGTALVMRVAFKPTSSIGQEQQTVTLEGEKVTVTLPEGSRHDPCIALRAAPVVEAMAALVLADHLLLNRTSQLAALFP